jgi:AcrR family transcriptional regulator
MASSAGRPVASDDNRWEQVVAAAVRVFDRKGYAAATVQDIADEAGIVKGTLYYYVRAKEDLLFKIISNVQEQLLPQLAAITELDVSAEEKLRTFVTWYVKHTIENRKIIGIFLRDFDSLSPRRRREITKDRDVYDQFLRDVLAQGQQTGEFRSDFDLHIVDFSIFGMIHWVYRWYNASGTLTPDEIARDMSNMVVRIVSSRDD